MKNDNHVLAEFAKDVRAAGDSAYLPLPWNKNTVAGADHQAAIVALYESGLLSYQEGKLYCSFRPNPVYRLRGVLGSIWESVLVVVALLSIVSVGTRSSDLIGMVVASAAFTALMLRGLRTSRYFHLYAKVPVDADSVGRIRNSLMFLVSWFAAALAVYFYRRVFVLDAYADGSLSLFAGIFRSVADGLWWEMIVGEGFMRLESGDPWWSYAFIVPSLIVFTLILWYLLWGVATIASNAEASNQLLANTGMLRRFNKFSVVHDNRNAQSVIALYSSLVALYVFFYNIYYYEKLALVLF